MSNKTILITGASTGIGAAIAVRLARAGLRVLAGVRRAEDGQRVASQNPERIHPVIIDVTVEESIQSALKEIESKAEDGLQGLVNNAGVAVGSPLEFVPMEMLRRQFEVNVFGLVRVTQVFLPLLRKGRGRVVNIGSISGRLATPLLGPYCASKHAVEALTDALRVELRPWKLDVSVIEPGAVATAIWEKGKKSADRLRTSLPPQAAQLYREGLEAIGRGIEEAEKRAVPADLVAGKVEHALLAARPRTRYLVGKDARLQAWLARWLPDRWRDALILRFMGME